MESNLFSARIPRSPPEKQRDRATKASQDPQAHGRPWCLSERREALRLPKEISYMEVSMNGGNPQITHFDKMFS